MNSVGVASTGATGVGSTSGAGVARPDSPGQRSGAAGRAGGGVASGNETAGAGAGDLAVSRNSTDAHVDSIDETTLTPATEPSPVTATLLSAGPLFGIGTSTGVFAGGALSFSVELARVWRLGASVSAATASSTNITIEGELRGAVSAVPLWASAQGLRCTTTSFRWCGGLDLGARLALATASGARLYRTGLTAVVAPTAGAIVTGDVQFGHWQLGFQLRALAPFTRPQVGVEGSAGIDVLNAFEASAALSVGYTPAQAGGR